MAIYHKNFFLLFRLSSKAV